MSELGSIASDPASDESPLLCCKSILSISARNIDSRSGWNAQQRFKRIGAPIRLLQISISQNSLGDFCNSILRFQTLMCHWQKVSAGHSRNGIYGMSPDQSAFAPENLTTLAHLSVSSE
jgi:hypothetical protein